MNRADAIWSAWQPHRRTVQLRGVFPVVFSPRADTDPDAVVHAVREFLAEEIAGDQWITAHRPETGHVHLHSMIAARDHLAKPLRFAVEARAQGVPMVVTRLADLAATRPFSQVQAGASERGRGDPRYLSIPLSSKRVERKRSGALDQPTLSSGQTWFGRNGQVPVTSRTMFGSGMVFYG